MDAPGQSREPHSPEGRPGDKPQFFGVSYTPTEDEIRALRECNEESFWYRALPVSVAAMILSYRVTNKGVFNTRSLIRSLPTTLLVGATGFVLGKVSYVSTCLKKLKKLKNSPIGESLRKGVPLEDILRNQAKQEEQGLEYPVKETTTRYGAQKSFGSAPVPEAPPSSSYSDEYSSPDWSFSNYEPVPFSASLSESSPTGITEHKTLEEPVPLLEESPKRKRVSYEELRNKNRDTHEIVLTQKTQTPVKSSQERPFKKEVKLNKYGDVWEE